MQTFKSCLSSLKEQSHAILSLTLISAFRNSWIVVENLNFESGNRKKFTICSITKKDVNLGKSHKVVPLLTFFCTVAKLI
jgi:hypothetical protein